MKSRFPSPGRHAVRGAFLAISLALFGCSTPPTEPATVEQPQTASVIQPVTALGADAFVNTIGVNTKLTYTRSVNSTGFYSIVKPKLLALGVRHARDEGVTATSDAWMQLIYGRMKELAAHGVKFDLIMRPAEGVTDYTRIYQWEKFLKYALPVVEDFEGMNEWDLKGRNPDWVTQVRSFQRAMFNQVKGDSRTRQMPVFAPSMGNPNNAIYVGDLSSWLNYGNSHPYPAGSQPTSQLNYQHSRIQAINGTRPWVVTETGYHNAIDWTGQHPPVSESASARYLSRLWLEYFRLGIRRSYLTELIDLGASSSNREYSFGLLRNDGSPKPAYVALQNLIGIHQDPGPPFTPGQLSYGLSGSLANIQQLLLQKRNGVFYLSLWQSVSSYDLVNRRDIYPAAQTVTVSFPDTVSQVRVFIPLTNRSALKTLAGVSSVTVGVKDSPTVIEVTR
jgi:hypothetical protein